PLLLLLDRQPADERELAGRRGRRLGGAQLLHDRHGGEGVVARGCGGAHLHLRRRNVEVVLGERSGLLAEEFGQLECHWASPVFLCYAPTCRNAGSCASRARSISCQALPSPSI